MDRFVQRHKDKITGVISCYDRVILTGTLPDLCHASAMAGYLSYRGIRIFDYPKWAEPLREDVRVHAEVVAKEAGLKIDFVRSQKAFRKEERVKEIIAEHGAHPGLIHVFSAMESCPSYRPWHDKNSGKTFHKPRQGKCLHYYFYFIDDDFGLCYMRVPTWAPFRLQVYFNGHYWLAKQLEKADIDFVMEANALIHIEDCERAQSLADQFDPSLLHQALNRWAARFCPVACQFHAGYHWSIMQVEYATDVIFRKQSELQPLYENIVRTAVHAIKVENVATFLGRKLTRAFSGEAGNDFSTRILGTRIKHRMGKASIKVYDKFALILRVETTTNDVTFFKHHRWVEHRSGEKTFKLAQVRKSIYSLRDLKDLMGAANRRYLAFMADIDDPYAVRKEMDKLAGRMRNKGRSFRGFNLFNGIDLKLLLTIAQGEWTISGFRAANLRQALGVKPGRASYLIKLLRVHGLIKKIGRQYKYYLTKTGRRIITTALVIREKLIVLQTVSQSA